MAQQHLFGGRGQSWANAPQGEHARFEVSSSRGTQAKCHNDRVQEEAGPHHLIPRNTLRLSLYNGLSLDGRYDWWEYYCFNHIRTDDAVYLMGKYMHCYCLPVSPADL